MSQSQSSVIVRITDSQSSFGLDGSESILNSTMMSNLNSTVSNNNNTLNMKYPETDEGIYWKLKTVIIKLLDI